MKPTKPTFTHSSSSFNASSSGTTTPSIVLPPELVQLFPPTSPTPQPLQPTLMPRADLSGLDLSLPLSTLLKSGTKIAHADAEHSPGAIALATGTLELQEYVRYLTILWVVYQELERQLDEVARVYVSAKGGEQDGSVDALVDIWSDAKGKGTMLRRSPGLASDIQYYLDYLSIPSPSPPPHPSIPFPTPPFIASILTHPPADLSAFTSHLLNTGTSSHPGKLLAHAYVRYLGDLSGGQLVASKIRRVYGLPPPPGGTSFYEFDLDERGEQGVSVTKEGGAGVGGDTLYERKKKVERIKDWFRDCMDGNVGDDEALKAELIQEAIISFKLSTRIFSMLEPPSPKSETTDGPPAAGVSTAHLSHRRPVHSPAAAVDGSTAPTTTTQDEKKPTTKAEIRAAARRTNPLENPPLSGNTELYLKVAMAVFVFVAYKMMSYLMLEEGEGLDRAGSRLAKFLGKE